MMPIIPENEDEKPFTPEAMDELAKTADEFRCRALFSINEDGADPFAIQHYLTALAHLDLAMRAFALAKLSQAQHIGVKALLNKTKP